MDYIPKSKPKKARRKSTRTKFLYTILKPNENNEKYFIGEIWFGKTNNVLPSTWNTCSANISSTDDEDKLILYFDSAVVVITLTTEINFLKHLLTTKILNMDFKLVEENVIVSLFISKMPLPRFNQKIGSVLKTAFSIGFNISCDYNDIQTIKSSAAIESFNELYNNVQHYRKELINTYVQHPKLKPTLRKYQQDAVRWMIQREQKSEKDEMLHPFFEEITLKSGVKIYFDKYTGYIDINKPMTKSLQTGGVLADEMGLGKTVEVLACILSHPSNSLIEISDLETTHTENCKDSWPIIDKQSRKRKIASDVGSTNNDYQDTSKKIKVPDEWVKRSSKKSNLRMVLESWYNSELSTDRTGLETPRVQCICGDITERSDCVECIDCSKVQHGRCMGYRKKYGDFYCPQCWINRPLLESNATLIVTPCSLKQQWCDEISKHIKGTLNVFLYERGQNLTPIYPTKLKNYDLVITTYKVLQSELRLSQSGHIVSLRRPPKYSLPGSPITLVNWWRLCLDEAQAVETPGRMVSEMAQKIHAHHRWAVTGTPISKDISDLYGLIDYLQFSPYNELDTWTNLFYKPYINGRKESMYKFLAKILWRTAKVDVIDQINIPQQTTVEHWLDFSDVEKFYYQRYHNLSSKDFLGKLKQMDLNVLLYSLNKRVLKRLIKPLLTLRQACCHHQAVRGKYLATRKQVNSMEDLLNALIAKNVQENEEYLRIIVSSLNGLAGIYLLLQNPNQAIEEYRKVLQLSARFCDKTNAINLEIDKLQLIHTTHNLGEVLEMNPSVSPTLRDGSLKNECKALEKEYLGRFTKQTFSAMEDILKYANSIRQLQDKFRLNPGQWFADSLDWVTSNCFFDEYVIKLTTIMHSANVMLKDTSERKILYMIAVWDEDITQLKETTLASIHQLFEMVDGETKMVIPDEVIVSATDCHLRPQDKRKEKKKKCLVCEANFNLKQYESKIFSTTQQNDDISNAGSWKPTPEEFMLRALHALGKQKNISPDILYDAEIHFQIIDALKKEFKEIRKLWTFVDTQVCAKDEVDMCKMRLRLKEKTNENESDRTKFNRIVKQLTQIEQNKLETIHMLDAHEIDYQRAVLQGEFKTNTIVLEKNLGTYKYLQTLHKQQTTGQTPDPCPICKNTLEKQWNILPCGHCYCVECIQVLLGQTTGHHTSCSVCRSKQLIADISLVDVENQKPNNDNEAGVKGNHSTKIEAVVRLIIKLRQSEKDVKVLVFSNWKVILKVLQQVFTSNDIQSLILQQYNFDKTLDKFKDKEQGISVLLLPVYLGSKGLNLIQATHIVFVEPLLNPGDELQAIGRIHRIGQSKPTVVHKFFIRNTIEENMHYATRTNADEWDSNKVTLGHIKQLFETESIPQFSNEVPDQAPIPQEGEENNPTEIS